MSCHSHETCPRPDRGMGIHPIYITPPPTYTLNAVRYYAAR